MGYSQIFRRYMIYRGPCDLELGKEEKLDMRGGTWDETELNTLKIVIKLRRRNQTSASEAC